MSSLFCVTCRIQLARGRIASGGAANNIAVCIPCHRVVRNDGAVSGYARCVDRKRALMEREAAPVGAGIPG